VGPIGITDIAHDGSLWYIVATKNTGIAGQRWARSDDFPEADIREAWRDGMHVQALEYGGGQWYVMFSARR